MIKAIKDRTGMFKYLDDADAEKILKSVDETQTSKLDTTELDAKLDEIGKEKEIRIKKQNKEVERRTGMPFKQGPYLDDVEEEGIGSLEKSIKKIKDISEEMKTVAKETSVENFLENLTKSQRYMEGSYKTGNIRTAVRFFMKQEAEAGRLKLSKDDEYALSVNKQTTESDPINIFRRYYGESALEAVDDIGDVFSQGKNFDHYVELLRNNVDPSVLKPKTKNIGKYDENVLTPQQEKKLKEQLLKEKEQKKILEEFDPTDRESSAHGGLIDILKL